MSAGGSSEGVPSSPGSGLVSAARSSATTAWIRSRTNVGTVIGPGEPEHVVGIVARLGRLALEHVDLGAERLVELADRAGELDEQPVRRGARNREALRDEPVGDRLHVVLGRRVARDPLGGREVLPEGRVARIVEAVDARLELGAVADREGDQPADEVVFRRRALVGVDARAAARGFHRPRWSESGRAGRAGLRSGGRRSGAGESAARAGSARVPRSPGAEGLRTPPPPHRCRDSRRAAAAPRAPTSSAAFPLHRPRGPMCPDPRQTATCPADRQSCRPQVNTPIAGREANHPRAATGSARRSPRTWPGTPVTVAPAGTSSVTTAFAPIFAPAPIRIAPRSFAPVPTKTSSSRTGAPAPGALARDRHVLAEERARPDHRAVGDHHPEAAVAELDVGADLRVGREVAAVQARRERRRWPPAGAGPGRGEGARRGDGR